MKTSNTTMQVVVATLIATAVNSGCATEDEGRDPATDERIVWMTVPASETAMELGGVVAWRYGIDLDEPTIVDGLAYAVGENDDGDEVVWLRFSGIRGDESPSVYGRISARDDTRSVIDIELPLSAALESERTLIGAAIQDWRGPATEDGEVAYFDEASCQSVVKAACSAVVAGTLTLAQASCGAICQASAPVTRGLTTAACVYGCQLLVGTPSSAACDAFATQVCDPGAVKAAACQQYSSYTKEMCTTEEWVCCSSTGGCSQCAPYGGYCPAGTHNCGYGSRSPSYGGGGGGGNDGGGQGAGGGQSCTDCTCTGANTSWEGIVCGSSAAALIDECWSSCW